MGEREEGQEEKHLVKAEDMSVDQDQLAEQLYNSAGLAPVVDAGLKDYEKRSAQEDKLISKVFGPRGSDIKGYGEAVAKRVALAVYDLLNKQYGGKVGDLRSYIMALEDERDRANTRYDELMGRVVGILGEEYKDLRSDSKEFMEKLTSVLGEDLKQSKIDHGALAERLADIDGLRSQIKTLTEEKEQLRQRHESEETALKNEHREQVDNLSTQIAELNSRVEGLESEKAALADDFAQLREAHDRLKEAVTNLASTISPEGIGEKLQEELHSFLLQDSKVPHVVMDGVGRFIDFRKYLRVAASRGAEEATKESEQTLRNAQGE